MVDLTVLDPLFEGVKGNLGRVYHDTKRLGTTVGDYLYGLIDEAGRRVATPYLNAHADLLSRAGSGPLIAADPKTGALTGRLPDLAALITSGLAGPVPGGALGAGPAFRLRRAPTEAEMQALSDYQSFSDITNNSLRNGSIGQGPSVLNEIKNLDSLASAGHTTTPNLLYRGEILDSDLRANRRQTASNPNMPRFSFPEFLSTSRSRGVANNFRRMYDPLFEFHIPRGYPAIDVNETFKAQSAIPMWDEIPLYDLLKNPGLLHPKSIFKIPEELTHLLKTIPFDELDNVEPITLFRWLQTNSPELLPVFGKHAESIGESLNQKRPFENFMSEEQEVILPRGRDFTMLGARNLDPESNQPLTITLAPTQQYPYPLRIPKPIEATHVSPHEFEAFDWNKIGSGEGNLDYGHGLYAAESPAARDYYINTLTEQHNVPSANVYDTRIHANPNHLIDYDARLTHQPQVLNALTNNLDFDVLRDLGVSPDTVLKAPQRIWGRDLAPHTEEQALDLAEAGIPGLRYLDAGSRGKSGDDLTRNYVMFDPALMEIKSRHKSRPK